MLVVAISSIFVFDFFNPNEVQKGRVLGANDWYNFSWKYKTKITIDHTKVGASLTDFPVLISSTNADWATTGNGGKAEQSDGDEFLFTASDNITKLSHEIEKYDPATGEIIAWVKVPSVSSSADTDINLYFGNASCQDQRDITGAWSEYLGVWHMNEASGATVDDATSTNADLTSTSSSNVTASGKFMKARTFNGSSDSLDKAATTSFDFTNGSISMWIYATWPDNPGYNPCPIASRDSSTRFSFHIGSGGGEASTAYIGMWNGSQHVVANGSAFSKSAWHLLNITINSGVTKYYIDGAQFGSNTNIGVGATTNRAFHIGSSTGSAERWVGNLDETRVSSTVRASEWIAAEYANQNSPATFYALGTTEDSDTTPPSNPSTIAGYNTSGKTVTLTDNQWASYANPYFEFSGAVDAESGVKGYNLYFGSDSGADPYTSGAYQTHSGAADATQSFTSSTSLSAGQTYYLIIGSINNMNVQSTKATLFTYKYDPTTPVAPEYVNVSPVGCSTQTSFTFSWPAGSDAGGSLLAGYDYKRGSVGVLQQTTELSVSASSYQEGDNVFYVRSRDGAGNTSSWQTAIYCSTASVQIVDGPTVAVGPSTMTVSWTSTKNTTSYVQVYEGNTYISEQGQTSYAMSHSVKVVGLEPERSYRYRLVWTDESGNIGEGDWYTTSTSTAPQINDLKVDLLGPTTANVSWKDSIAAINTIQYGEGAYSTAIDTSGYATTGSYKLQNLTSGKTYQLRINATSEDGTKFFAGTSFSMPPLPEISSIAYEVSDTNPPTAKVSWKTNVETTSSLFYGPAGSSKKEIALSDKVKDHDITIESLPSSSSYEFYVSGTDQFNNTAKSSVLGFATPADRRPPVISEVTTETSNVGLSQRDKAQIIVSWKTDEPSTSYVEYDAGLSGADYRNKTTEDKGLTTSHLVIIADLSPSQPYHLRVGSVDKNGNLAKSDDTVVVAGEVTKSILSTILQTFTNVFGWIGLK